MRWFVCLWGVMLWGSLAHAGAKKPDLGLLRMQCDEGGLALQCAQAGVLLEQQKKIKLAARYHKKACFATSQAQGTSCYLLALLLADPKEALLLYRRACTLNESDGCTGAAEQLRKSKDPKVRAEVIALYRKGCKLGDGRGCHRVARSLFKKKRDKEALPLLQRACQLQYAPGCGYLGWYYESKAKARATAEKLFRRGCSLRGGSIECARLGLLLMRKGEPHEALRFLRKSCRLRFQPACMRARQLSKSLEPAPRP